MLLLFLFSTPIPLLAYKHKKRSSASSCETSFEVWALTDSNRRPSACKADALNQLS